MSDDLVWDKENTGRSRIIDGGSFSDGSHSSRRRITYKYLGMVLVRIDVEQEKRLDFIYLLQFHVKRERRYPQFLEENVTSPSPSFLEVKGGIADDNV